MKKLNILLLIALLLGAAYLRSSAVAGAALLAARSGTEQAGAAIASVIVLPHLLLTAIAVLFNARDMFMNKRRFALAASIYTSSRDPVPRSTSCS